MNNIAEKPTYFLGIDIGGTWVKACLSEANILLGDQKGAVGNNYTKVKSSLHKNTTIEELVALIQEVIANLEINNKNINGIGISTGGIIDYQGSKILKAAFHFNVLKNIKWKEIMEQQFQCRVTIINDADAAAIGLAETGYLEGDKTIGIMPIGTGLGFSIWKNGRRWRPGRIFPLLGEVKLAGIDYNLWASASRLASLDKNNDLLNVLGSETFRNERESYVENLISIIETAAILYGLDEVLICGGLVDAANNCGYALDEELDRHFKDAINLFDKNIKVRVAKEGNALQLIGTLALAKGEYMALRDSAKYNYAALDTETPYNRNFHPENMKCLEIIRMFWEAEQEAGEMLKQSLPIISLIVEQCIEKLRSGGRIIYVGAGSSGRIAAMDCVEIPCTYGFPKERIVTLIAGGISDAAIDIESDFEEDASAIPEMLLLNVTPNDVVIGISASGTAYYVQSALAQAKAKKALTVMLQARLPEKDLQFCDHVISLNSGSELIAGSTRMKAGTATKKILNFFSSTLMIKLGKVVGPYMVDVVCTNNKLVERAQSILKEFYDMDSIEAMESLNRANMDLRKVINTIEKGELL